MQGIVAPLFAFEAVPLSAFYMCFGFHGEMKEVPARVSMSTAVCM